MKYLKKVASKEEAVAKEYDVLYYVKDGVNYIKTALPTYTIKFKDFDDSVILSKVYVQGETITMPSNPTREGFDFIGWNPTVSETAVADATYIAQYEEVDPNCVNLGLPSGIKWATCNVGATKPEEYGLYFQWGDIVGYKGDEAKAHSTWKTCPFNNNAEGFYYSHFKSISGTVCQDNILKEKYDAAHSHMGDGWRMPTSSDISELLDNTTRVWTSKTASDGSTVYGREYTSKANGNKLFIPAAGCYNENSVEGIQKIDAVWSSNIQLDYFSNEYKFAIALSEANLMRQWNRCRSVPIRGVKE